MAEAVRLRFRANIGVGITGTSEPDKIDGKSVSKIYIGIDDGKNKRVVTDRYPADRTLVRLWAVAAALFALRKTLITHG